MTRFTTTVPTTQLSALSEYLIVFLSSSSSSLNLNIVFLLLSLHAKVLSVKMVSQHQSKDSGSKKNGGKELGMVTPQEKSSKKMKFASSSAEAEPTSTSLMIQSLVEAQIPKDIKEQIWEAVDIAFVGEIKPTPETYKFIEKAQWDAFVASRLSKDFESVHSQHAQIREKLEYNHRLSRKGYAGLEDQLKETMPGVEIDRSTLWKRARQDKHGNIPDPKGLAY
ncbi:non-ATPase subunit 9 [Prunus dulcis]|uniref:Non-ATPase subunit 9 n=1 Tax=Prunus dulcis TaxID=3755 RepID=A0A5H2XQW1_PRUDU|nr:non-ATPase subunit 9 [Prunus dulcis]